MHPHRKNRVFLLLLTVMLLGGCSFPWDLTPSLPDPQNLLLNPDAGNDGLGWTFDSDHALVQSDNSDPVFAISYETTTIRQSVNVSNVPGKYVVLMAITATEAADFYKAIIQGRCYDIAHPELRIGGLHLADNVTTPDAQRAWVVVAEYGPKPTGTGRIEVVLSTGWSGASNVPPPWYVPAPWEWWGTYPEYDGEWTWFDDVELWIVETEQEAIDLINAYTQIHGPGSRPPVDVAAVPGLE